MERVEVQLKQRARELGFSLAGIAPATEADGFARFQQWLERGYAGEMKYLPTREEARRHPRSILESVRSVLMVGMEYCGIQNAEEMGSDEGVVIQPRSAIRKPQSMGRVAAYAQGPDYHRVIWDRLNTLAAWLREESPGCRTVAVTDTAPLLERDFARRAGLGWIGKNTMLIHPLRGSFFFLGALLTDLRLQADEQFSRSHCGTCTACLDACPTNAFPEPHVLDARRCISYLTIELRKEIPNEFRAALGDWLFGCDVCQDVCPWNRKPRGEAAFPYDPTLAALDPVELLGMDAESFRRRFKQTSLWRTRRGGLLRNAAIVLGNVGGEDAIPALERAATDEEEVVREAAKWALQQICERVSFGRSSR